jgi:uncharacterized protein (TIGR02391 family)
MQEIAQAIPDVDVLLGLEPEELGAYLLFALRQRQFSMGQFQISSLIGELWDSRSVLQLNYRLPYANNRQAEVKQALAEAFGWLEAHALIIPDPENGRYGWKILSRRAKRFENQTEFARYAVARMLPKEALHSRLANEVWMAFMRGQFDVAVFQAMKAVEVAVRNACGNDAIGVSLMRNAFNPKGGPLADPNADPGEQIARMELFAGAIGSYKNPQSHRDVDLQDPMEAIEIILLANHLLKIVDSRLQALAAGLPPSS